MKFLLGLNPLMVAGTLLMAGASAWEYLMRSGWKLATVYLSYAVANAVLSSMGGK